jgi:hypothetical protein
MKVFANILKILAILAAIAGIVYVVATYGDKIVAWAKKTLRRTQKERDYEDMCFFDDEECCETADFEA